jgi:hypothetical protein
MKYIKIIQGGNVVSKFNLGTKRVCVGCSIKFYDLEKNPASCPKCKTMNDINAQYKVRRKNKAAIEVDNDDPLIKNKAKQDAKQKLKKPNKRVEGVDLEDFDDIVVVQGEDEIEEIEEIEEDEDIDDIGELDDVESEEEMDDDIALDDDSLIDKIDDEEEDEDEYDDEEEDEDGDDSSKRGGKGKNK